MLATLFVYYNRDMSSSLKQQFVEDFKVADKVLLISIIVTSFIAAFITSLKFGYFTLGILGGGLTSIICLISYNISKGTPICRIVMATALSV